MHVFENPYFHPVTLAHLQQLWTQPYGDLYEPMGFMVWGGIALASGQPSQASGRFIESGFDPSLFHIGSLGFHLLDVLLVFWLLRIIVTSRWGAMLGAAAFAVHPLQVESVAWISELRCGLSACFGLLAIITILKAARSSQRRTQVAFASAATALFALAVLSKPSLLILPLFIVIILWYVDVAQLKAMRFWLGGWVVLAILFGPFVSAAQGVDPRLQPPLLDRPLVAADALLFYAEKLFLPVRLAIDYGRLPSLAINSQFAYLKLALIVALLVAVCRFGSRTMVCAVGLFVIGLLPVLGFVSFQFQIWSTVGDRYVYFGMLGVAIAIAATVAHHPKLWVRAGAASVIVIWAVMAFVQTGTWRDSESLFQHELTVNPNSFVILKNMGILQTNEGHATEAVAYLKRAVELMPLDGGAHSCLGTAYLLEGDNQAAIAQYEKSTQLLPESSVEQNNLGLALARSGNVVEAASAFRQALFLDPGNVSAHDNLGLAYLSEHQTADAIAEFRRALSIDPNFASARVHLQNSLQPAPQRQ